MVLLAAGIAALLPAPRLHASASDAETLGLLPYTVGEGDLPSGWTIYSTTASTNVAVAFAAGDAASGTLLALESAGRVAGLQQTFNPPRGSHSTSISLVAELYRDGDAALVALRSLDAGGSATVVPDFWAAALPGAWAQHTVSAGDSGAVQSYIVAWSNGALLTGVAAIGPTVDTQALLSIAAAAYARTNDPPSGTVDADGDADDLAVVEAMDAAQLPASAAPAGFDRAGAYVWSDAQLALDARAPGDAAADVIDGWGRRTGEAEYFVARDGSRTTLTTGYALFHDAAGASAALHDLSLYSVSRQAALLEAPPVQLGDDTVALRTVVLWPGGELRDGYVLTWQHGDLLLSVTVIEPEKASPPAYLAAVAGAFEAAYAEAQPIAA
jgi:hypothetical protein